MAIENWAEMVLAVRQQVLLKKNQLEYDAGSDLQNDELHQLIGSVIRSFAVENDYYMSPLDRAQMSEEVFNSMRGLGILQPLIDDETITEIMVNGPNCIFIEQNGRLFEYDKHFESEDKLEEIVRSIVESINREINPSTPIQDARLQDGSRVSAVVKPVALNGPILTIRKFSKVPLTIDLLMEKGSITKDIADLLKELVVSKYNIFISGGTGSGKTTFLNALSNFIPADERIITIEDSAELQIQNIRNLVRLETKNANVEGKGAVAIRDLIKASLRMRPDRIVVGEVRGAEALDMLQAMNTGHDGSLSTGHANSTNDMLSRLETMVLTGADIPLDAIRNQIASALDIIVHLGRLRDRSRKVLAITEVLECESGKILLNPLYRFDDRGDSDGKVNGELAFTGNLLVSQEKLKASGSGYCGEIVGGTL